MAERFAEIEEQVYEASSILVLLDGEKLHYFMQWEDPPVLNPITYDLKILIPLVMIAGADVPVHFVVTKWDVLEADYSLLQVRERLMEVPAFANMIERGPGKENFCQRIVRESETSKELRRLKSNEPPTK